MIAFIEPILRPRVGEIECSLAMLGEKEAGELPDPGLAVHDKKTVA
jgi:hypothetical protein